MPFSHQASETVQLLRQMTPDFISATLWPSKSPHLNPKEYAVWGIMQFIQEEIKDVGELRQLILEEWNGNNSAII